GRGVARARSRGVRGTIESIAVAWNSFASGLHGSQESLTKRRRGNRMAPQEQPKTDETKPSGVPMNHDSLLRKFAGAVAIVTGGGSGIGRAVGEALARRGARVILADLQIDLAEDVAARIRTAGGQATAEGLDVTDFDATSRFVQSSFQCAGRLDYIF